jgi:membrane protease YdiL (CAAX protease family)
MLGRVIPFLATLLVGLAQFFAMRPSSPPIAAWGWIGLAYAVCGVVSLVYLFREEAHTELLRFVAGDATRGLFAAAGALVVVYGVSVAAISLLPTFAIHEIASLVRVVIAIPQWKRAIAIVVLAAVEEIVWRGAVIRALEPALGSSRAAWAAGALYVLAVVPSLRVGLVGAAIVLAVAMTLLVRRSGRVTPAIIGHAMFSWLGVEWVLSMLWQRIV